MKKYEYKIGDWVTVKNEISFYYDEDNNRKIDKKEVNKIGQIIGAAKRQLGKIKGYSSYSEDQPYFKVKEVLTVRFGMINKPIEVLDEDIEHLSLDIAANYILHETLPWMESTWTEKDRDAFSKDMKMYFKDNPNFQLRDGKGRFTK